MKILMLNYEFPPMGGGAGNATDNISKQLVKLGHDVTVITSNYGGLNENENKYGVKIIRVASWRKSIHDCGFKGAYSYLFFAALKLKKLCKNNNYDIIHYFFSLPTGLLTLIPGAHRKIPYIVSLRGSDVPYYDVFNKKVHIFNMLLKPINKYIWKKSRRVIALSEGLKSTALKTAPEQQIEVIPNGIESDVFKPFSKKEKKFKLITVSRLINRKGINHILEALTELNDKKINLLIVGTGSYGQHLKDMCKKLYLDDVVTFYGYCPRKKLPELYNQADIFILPSLAESFGLVFAEAMACGLPVIAGRTGGVPDLIKEENGILVEPGNVEEIKKAILAISASQESRLNMGRVNRDKVVKNYSWRRIAQEYFDIYKVNTKNEKR